MGSEPADGIDVLLSADDYVAASMLHSRWTRKRIWTSAAATAIGLALAAVGNHWLLVAGSALAGGAIGGAVAYEVARRLFLPWRARRLFAQQRSLQRPVQFTWDAEGLSWSSANGSGRTPWSDYVKWRQNEHILLLYHSDALFQMLPKRAFSSDLQLPSLLARLGTRGHGFDSSR